jgi:hypothetical protein
VEPDPLLNWFVRIGCRSSSTVEHGDLSVALFMMYPDGNPLVSTGGLPFEDFPLEP